jgi:hypothetical protein
VRPNDPIQLAPAPSTKCGHPLVDPSCTTGRAAFPTACTRPTGKGKIKLPPSRRLSSHGTRGGAFMNLFHGAKRLLGKGGRFDPWVCNPKSIEIDRPGCSGESGSRLIESTAVGSSKKKIGETGGEREERAGGALASDDSLAREAAADARRKQQQQQQPFPNQSPRRRRETLVLAAGAWAWRNRGMEWQSTEAYSKEGPLLNFHREHGGRECVRVCVCWVQSIRDRHSSTKYERSEFNSSSCSQERSLRTHDGRRERRGLD